MVLAMIVRNTAERLWVWDHALFPQFHWGHNAWRSRAANLPLWSTALCNQIKCRALFILMKKRH